jgi:hypothetical protein
VYQLQSREGELKENLTQDAAELATRIKERSANSSNPTITSLANYDIGKFLFPYLTNLQLSYLKERNQQLLLLCRTVDPRLRCDLP